MMSDDRYNAQGNRFTAYIDVDSFAKNYVVQELMFNVDGCQSSSYMLKEAGDAKLVPFPVRDLDLLFDKAGEVTPKEKINPGYPALWFITAAMTATANTMISAANA